MGYRLRTDFGIFEVDGPGAGTRYRFTHQLTPAESAAAKEARQRWLEGK